jgi:hypothetical protein
MVIVLQSANIQALDSTIILVLSPEKPKRAQISFAAAQYDRSICIYELIELRKIHLGLVQGRKPDHAWSTITSLFSAL